VAKLEKKIFLEKNDDLDKAVGELVAVEAEKVILNIPRGSVLSASVHNFQVLERESETAGKELAIESVDERVLELASLATIPAVNPVFKTRERFVADILPAESEIEEEPAGDVSAPASVVLASIGRSAGKPKARGAASKNKEPRKETGKPKEEKPKREKRKKKTTEKEAIPIIIKETEKSAVPETFEDTIPKREFIREEKEVGEEAGERPAHKKRKRGLRLWATVISSLIVVIGAGYFIATDFLPKVTVSIAIKKTTVPFSKSVIVDRNISTPSVNGGGVSLPGQLTVARNNLNMVFPATGSSTVSAKAAGTMVIHNDYVKDQTLRATTRFESPDGKIFRLIKQVSIPKSQSVEAQVVADQAGPDYNISPVKIWQVPGFKGMPQYGKVYGESKTSMTGGSFGNQLIPSATDISEAKMKIENALSDSLKSQTLILNSQNLKLLDGASSFSVTSENISSQVDKDGNFSIYAAGELRQLVFDENMLRDVIVGMIATSTKDVKVDDFSLDYSTSTADLVNGKLSFPLSGTLVYEPKIDFDAFKNSILGLEADALKMAVFALPGLERANISFWPFWVKSVPGRDGRIFLNVE
jgi:hypothetical protein